MILLLPSRVLVAAGVLLLQVVAQQHDIPYSRSLRGDQPAINITFEYTIYTPVVVIINVNDRSEFQQYANEYDILEASDETMTVTAIVNDEDLAKFEEDGVSYTIDETTTAEFDEESEAVQQTAAAGEEDALEKADGTLISFKGISKEFSCYRTVEETYATAKHIETTYPNIAEWIGIGPSWDRTQNNGKAGYEMKVLKLTNKATTGIVKPIMFATCSIHARELAPAELCTRFAETLVQSYGDDADITALIDHQEIHLILIGNPDGRKMAEAGVSWRKNTDPLKKNNRSCNGDYGVDLNRNWPYGWGGEGASSSCNSQIYRGAGATSEVETQNILKYMDSLGWGNQRNLPESYYNSVNICRSDTYCPSSQQYPAPPNTTTGIALDIHAYGELMLWPWGYTASKSGNDAQYVALGRKLAHSNGYKPQQSTSLYVTAGTTCDTW